MKKQKRLAAFVLVLVLLLAAVPVGVSAAEEQEPADQQLTQEQLTILEANLIQTSESLDAAEPTLSPKRIHHATRLGLFNEIYPAATMESMTTLVGQTMNLQFVCFCNGYRTQAAFVEIYKGEIAEDTCVGSVTANYPASEGDYEWETNWNTSKQSAGTYYVVFGTLFYDEGQWIIINGLTGYMEVYLTKTAAPLKNLYLKDADTDKKVTAKTMNVGDADYCCYVAFDPAKTTAARKVVASSSNIKVAKVEEFGGCLYITPVGPGTCNIVAYAGGKQAPITITVYSPATSIKLDKTDVTMHVGETVTLKATVTPSNTTDKVTWTSSDATVAPVNNGVVTAHSDGIVNISARAGGFTAVCLVKVSPHEFTSTESELSCTTPDATIRTCTICGAVEQDVRTPALGHDWDEGTVITEATEEANGLLELTCQRCGETKHKVIPATGGTCTGDETCPSNAFIDVPAADNWAHAGIDFVVSRNLFSGMTETTFGPANSMQRCMLVAVLWRLDGRPEPVGTNTFTDVKAGEYYEKAVVWASENKIVAGVGNNKFDPKGNVTREQLASFLYRYARFKEYDIYTRNDISTFPDADKVSAYANDPLCWATAENLISGTTSGNTVILNPKGNATRAQVAAILMRFAYNISGDDLSDRVG